MNGDLQEGLSSARLSYRLLEPGDRDALRRILAERSVTEPAGFLPAGNEAEFDDFFAELTRYGAGVAILREDTLVGYVRIHHYRPDQSDFIGKNCVSLGLVIGKRFQGQGYGTEALRALTERLKRRCDYCFASHFLENGASRRIIEKCGYRCIGQYTLFFEEFGRPECCVEYVY